MVKAEGYIWGNVGKVRKRTPILMISPIILIGPISPIDTIERFFCKMHFLHFAFSGAFAPSPDSYADVLCKAIRYGARARKDECRLR